MRTLRTVVVALLCAVLLSSCSSARPGPASTLYVDSQKKTDARMTQIAAALNKHDAGALKAMFSAPALEQSTDIDGRLDHLLALFPNGGVKWTSWDYDTAEREYKKGKLTEVWLVQYKLSANGKHYELFFADFTVNEIIDPHNVGLYALGVEPWTSSPMYSCSGPFFSWACSIHANGNDKNGYPGVYVAP